MTDQEKIIDALERIEDRIVTLEASRDVFRTSVQEEKRWRYKTEKQQEAIVQTLAEILNVLGITRSNLNADKAHIPANN